MEFLKQKLNLNFFQNFQPKLCNGWFSAVNTTNARVRTSVSDDTALLELRTDFVGSGRRKVVDVDSGCVDYSGINKKYITENGSFDPECALAEFSKTAVGKRLVTDATDTTIRSKMYNDSHHMFLYNMLISWMKAWLYRSSGGRDDVFVAKGQAYKDAHREVSLDYGFGDVEHSIECEPPNAGSSILNFRNPETYWRYQYIIYINSGSAEQVAFYASHVDGRNSASPLNFDINLPKLDGQWALETTTSFNDHVDPDDVDWTDHDMMWSWIMDYVVLNRLESQFAAAFETICSAAFQPMPSTQEACVWQHAKLRFQFARFTPTRALIRTALEGEPYLPSNLPKKFILDEVQYFRQYVIASALLNYYMWYGLYGLLVNEFVGVSDWRAVCSGLTEGTSVLQTPQMRAYAISAVTGQEMSTLMTGGANLTIDYREAVLVKKLDEIRNLEPGLSNHLRIDSLPAPVSGSLILGACGGQLEVVEHLLATQRLRAIPEDDGYRVGDLEALQYANAYRLFGHDSEFIDEDGRLVKAWGPVKEAIIERTSLFNGDGRLRYFTASDTRPRSGRNYPLPHVFHMMKMGGTMTILSPTIRITEFGSRTQTITVRHTLVRRKRTPVMTVNGKTVTVPDTVRAVVRPKVTGSGFPKARQATVAQSSAPGVPDVPAEAPPETSLMEGDVSMASELDV